MNWIQSFDLFLFDFDGLLVNTEEIHFAAFREMCRREGCELSWSLPQYLGAAHQSTSGLKQATVREFPGLEKNWELHYNEKKKIYEELLEKETVSLLPGVETVLKTLDLERKKRCVVTNSTKDQVDVIKKKIPILATIPHWFTREDYSRPKPDPDGYLTALKTLGAPTDRTIGFEDSLRGFQALKGAGISLPVLICSPDHPQMREFQGTHFPTLEAFLDTSLSQEKVREVEQRQTTSVDL